MHYVAEESQIKIVRSKLLLKYGRSCDSCEYFNHHCEESLAYDFYGPNEKCTVGLDRGLSARHGEIPEMRVCARWALAELAVTSIQAEREAAKRFE